ncbi:MAG: HD domain-containing protein [Candidatus Pacebacteria bacterium]|nr:HD domain-containing protein [Candidatus Paceibacterota bacterium]MBT4651977.1 HD domain-containing protein [Candidatus Paceibacterota bacterium]MBT6755999.1 HD domain-containing protein [Candidatus Paceibacterota bacterium]MBT6920813.1 HD domain-containing protein [Candidatus Paceibacterota bacterium]
MKLELPFEVLFISHTLQKAGFESHLVGGAIRDLVLQSTNAFYHKNIAITDYDFTTNAQPEKIMELFPESFYENNFGTVSITHENTLYLLKNNYQLPEKNLLSAISQNKKTETLIDLVNAKKLHESLEKPIKTLPSEEKQPKPFEITTYRTDGTYHDHRRPESVTWGKTIEEDLERRDFTINALAIKINPSFLEGIFSEKIIETSYSLESKDFTLTDPHNGIEDLAQSTIEAVGDPNLRFKEDALRMLRAIRFSVQLGMSIGEKTLTALGAHAPLIQHVSWERIRDEFMKMIASQDPKKAILLLEKTKMLEYVLPEILEMKGVEQSGHHTTNVWVHSLDALNTCPSADPIVRLATLLHDAGKPRTFDNSNENITFYNHEIISSRIASKVAKRFKFSKKNIDRMFTLTRFHMFHYQPQNTDASIRRFMRKVGLENIDDILDLREGDRLGSGAKKTSWRLEEMKQRMVEQLNQPMAVKDIAINGNDLMTELNLKPGKNLGIILQQLFEEVMENSELNTKEILLEKAKEISKNL